jgi:hypothetical protein
MPSISCFYNHYNRQPINFIFIEFEKFVKVMLNARSVILKKEDLASNPRLLQIFMLSLVLTEDTLTVFPIVDHETNKIAYALSTIWYWKNLRMTDHYHLSLLEKSSSKNPLNASEPKRASSSKKVRKFFKSLNVIFDNEMVKEPIDIFNEFFEQETAGMFDYFKRYIEHERKVEMLSVILHNYGNDVYSGVRKFL